MRGLTLRWMPSVEVSGQLDYPDSHIIVANPLVRRVPEHGAVPVLGRVEGADLQLPADTQRCWRVDSAVES